VAAPDGEVLSGEEQATRRAYFRDHFEHGVAYNRDLGLSIVRYDADGVEFHLPYRDRLSAHDGVFHGGVVAALLDTTSNAAVFAGHDFAKGSRISTVSMSVTYAAPARCEVLVARGCCRHRGGRLHFADVDAYAGPDGQLVATAQVVVSISGERQGVPWAS